MELASEESIEINMRWYSLKKVWYLTLFTVFTALIVSACNPAEQKAPVTKSQLSREVTVMHGDITNLEKFYEFVKNVENGKPDSVRVTKYTIEGQPIYHDLKYNGKKIEYTVDNSQDGYAGLDRGKRNTECVGIEKSEQDIQGETFVKYTLKDCDLPSNIGRTFLFTVKKK